MQLGIAEKEMRSISGHRRLAGSEKVDVDFEALKESANRIPIYELLGMRVEEVSEGYARFRMPFRHEITQPMGVIHGGALAAMADSAVAVALWSMVGMDKIFTTIEMKINYISSVGSGEVIAEGTIIHCGRRTAVGEVTLTNLDGKLVGKCIATYMIIPMDETNAPPPTWRGGGESSP